MQGKEIILRLQGSLGMYRLTVNENTTYKEVKTKVEECEEGCGTDEG